IGLGIDPGRPTVPGGRPPAPPDEAGKILEGDGRVVEELAPTPVRHRVGRPKNDVLRPVGRRVPIARTVDVSLTAKVDELPLVVRRAHVDGLAVSGRGCRTGVPYISRKCRCVCT